MNWNLWLDDERDPEVFLRVRPSGIMTFEDFRPYVDEGFSADSFVWCKTVAEAIEAVQRKGTPSFMALDHDLGENTDVFDFLSWLTQDHLKEAKAPSFRCHSSNPTGRQNVKFYLQSWNRSRSL